MRTRYLVVCSSYFDFSSKYVRWLYVPPERHITTCRYFCSRTKNAFKLPSGATFTSLNSHICSECLSSQICQMLTSTISGICHREVNLARVKSFINISFLTSTQTRKFSSYNIECEQYILSFAPHTLIFLKNMSDGYMSRQREI